MYKLYKPAIMGSVSIIIGSLLNKIAIIMNHNKMPVFPFLSYYTGYIKAEDFLIKNDYHILGKNIITHFFILTDYIDVGFSILSIGDLFIHLYVLIMIYYLIKQLNINANKKLT